MFTEKPVCFSAIQGVQIMILHTQYSGYVFRRDIRYFFLFCGVFVTVSITAFSGFMWYVSFTQPSPEARLIAILLDLFVLYLAYVGWRNFQILNMRFTLDDHLATNTYGRKTHRIPLEPLPTIQEITVPFAIVKSTMDIPFFLITSNTPTSRKVPGKGGLEEVRQFCEYGAVILPADHSDLRKFINNQWKDPQSN